MRFKLLIQSMHILVNVVIIIIFILQCHSKDNSINIVAHTLSTQLFQDFHSILSPRRGCHPGILKYLEVRSTEHKQTKKGALRLCE